jgi:hypothetical protein
MSVPQVLRDRSHTCIELSRKFSRVSYIPLDSAGLDVLVMNEKDFDKAYKPMQDYPVDKAARLYAEYAANIGGTKEAMQALANLTTLTSKDIEMATTKKAAASAAKAEASAKARANSKTAKPKDEPKAPEPKAPTTKKVAPVTKAPEPKAPAKPAAKKAAKADTPPWEGEEKKPRVSASQMFKDLIMEGKLDDRQIFEKVQKAFSLDENKFSYVNWNYQDLVRKGMNPPELKRVAE